MDPMALNNVPYTSDPVGGPTTKLKLKLDPPVITEFHIWILMAKL